MSTRGQKLLARLTAGHSLAGNTLEARMRSATFALLGITAALCLGFVAVLSSQGWSVFSLGPLPAGPGPQTIGAATPFPSEGGGGSAGTESALESPFAALTASGGGEIASAGARFVGVSSPGPSAIAGGGALSGHGSQGGNGSPAGPESGAGSGKG